MPDFSRKVEFELLRAFVRRMEAEGANRNLIRLDIDKPLAEQVSAELGEVVLVEELRQAADRCLANEWLEHRVMAGKYGQLGLTTEGFGVVRSRQRKEQQLADRSKLQVMSDYIVDHRGLFIALGAGIGLTGLLLKLFFE